MTFNLYSTLVSGCFCREKQTIAFYNTNNLRTAVQNYSVAPDHPGRLCTLASSPGMLVYTDCYSEELMVLDCDYYPPIPTNERIKIQIKHTGNHSIRDMCCVTCGKKDLLITTHGCGGVHAYFTGTNVLMWYFGGSHPVIDKWINAVGVTTNGRGQLFICDTNNSCIQMLSTNGRFLGTVLRSGNQGLGNPERIKWCKKANSLVIAHEKQGVFNISVIQWLYSP